PRDMINAENRQQRRAHTNNDVYCIIDSGADVTSLGANWFITHRDEHSNYAISGPESLHQTPVQMDKVTGITKVNSTNGPILLRAHQASASTLGTPPEIETLINPAQLRHKGIKVYDLAHIFDGSQCIIIKQNYDKDIIIPLQYNGNCILHHTHPTTDDISDLPMYDITSDKEWRPPAACSKVDFDISKCKANRRLKRSKKGMFTRRTLKRWADQLYITDNNVVKKTLLATTQLALVEPPSTISHLKQHENDVSMLLNISVSTMMSS
ncbi:MAG: hypothetical protein ACREOZ_04025, partial [Gloeomargaritales cyanobacterium]